MFFIIHICSKNENSLQKFLQLFLDKQLNNHIKFEPLKKVLKYKTEKKIFTVLKSPHVNKTAQEQFEYRLYKKKIKINSNQFFLFLIFLKKIKLNLFSDLNFKIELIFNKKESLKKIKNTFNVDNYFLENDKYDLKNYLKILNLYGTLVLMKKSLDSSVG